MKFPVLKLSAKVVLFGMAVLLVSCGPSPSYRSFMRRSQEYYASLARACETILAENGTLIKQRKLSGTDQLLPPIIRDLHPAYVYVNSNSVGLRIGTGRGSYWVGWSQNFYDQSLWELETSAEGMRRVVASRRKFSLPTNDNQ